MEFRQVISKKSFLQHNKTTALGLHIPTIYILAGIRENRWHSQCIAADENHLEDREGRVLGPARSCEL